MDGYITVNEASKILDVCSRQIRNYIHFRDVIVKGKVYRYAPLFNDVITGISKKNVRMYLINKDEVIQLTRK